MQGIKIWVKEYPIKKNVYLAFQTTIIMLVQTFSKTVWGQRFKWCECAATQKCSYFTQN